MALPGRGHGASIGLFEESTWGTSGARTNWMQVNANSLKRNRVTTVSGRLGRIAQASSNPRDKFVSSDNVEGAISFEMAYDDSTIMMLKHMLGANVTAGAGPFTHTLTLASPVPIGLSIEAIPGTFPFNAAQLFTGCKFGGGSISCKPGSPLVCEVNVIGKTSGGLVAPGTPTYSSNGELILQHNASAITLGGTAIPLKSFTINIDRGLERNPEVGSLNTSEPVETRLQVTIDAVAVFQQADFHTKYFADTGGSFTTTFTSGAKSLALTGHNAFIDSLEEPVSSAGMVEQKIKLRTLADASNQGLTLVFTNANALHSAN